MPDTNNPTSTIMAPLVHGKMWIKLLAVMLILGGALQALTIVGILWAWVPIWLGVLMFQAIGAAEQAVATGDPATAVRANEKLRLFFMIQGLLMLVGLVLMAAAFMLGGVAVLGGLLGS